MPDSLDHHAILATWSDWRPVKGRKVLQLVFEVPLDQQQEVLTRLGPPLPDRALWVGIALCTPPATSAVPATAEVPRETRVEQAVATGTNDNPKNSARSEAGKIRYRYSMDEMEQAVTRAALLCKDRRFQEWMRNHGLQNTIGATLEDRVALALKRKLGIESRSAIAGDERAFREFLSLELSYQQAVGLAASPR